MPSLLPGAGPIGIESDGKKLENATDRDIPSTTPKQGLVQRLKKINRVFLLTVAIPTTAAILYYGLIASDVYVSESRFVVRSPQKQTQTNIVGALLQGTGFARAQDDTYPVIDYIQSRDALRELNARNYIVREYSDHGDLISRFGGWGDNSFEDLWEYYGKRIASVDFDSTSAITKLQVRAFTAKDAATINERLLEMSERLVNRMNRRAATDTVAFAEHEVDLATARAKDAAAALARYRKTYTVFDPDKQSALQLQQATTLQTQMLAAQTQLAQLEAIAPKNPQIAVLKTSIANLQQQIEAATTGVAGGKNSLADKAAVYARMQLDSQFADKQLASAMGALENARAEAQRKQLYLERLIEPNTPDIAIEPKRLKGIFEVFALGMIAWGILTLLIAGVREHND